LFLDRILKGDAIKAEICEKTPKPKNISEDLYTAKKIKG
jgi:hypothetical protein